MGWEGKANLGGEKASTFSAGFQALTQEADVGRILERDEDVEQRPCHVD